MIISGAVRRTHRFALLDLGFRPFFLLAASFAALSIARWGGIIAFGWSPPPMPVSPSLWHAHEMIFGYAFAVIAGFLLTAVHNWTGQPGLSGVPLALLCLPWLLARLLQWFMPGHQAWAALCDLLFEGSLLLVLAVLLWRARQKRQIVIVFKLTLLALANLVWYYAAGHAPLAQRDEVMRMAIESGLYMLLSLILLMLRRTLPVFIEHGVGGRVKLKNSMRLDYASLVFMLLLWLVDVFGLGHGYWHTVVAVLAALLCLLHGGRFALWCIGPLWRKPLLAVLMAGYAFIILGFALKALVFFWPQLALPAWHAFGVGGIGLITLGMMARVSLGHSGRNIHQPPAVLRWIFVLLGVASIARMLPAVWPELYQTWIALAQIFWVAAFLVFALRFAPILCLRLPRAATKF